MTHKTVTFRNSLGVERVIFEIATEFTDEARRAAWDAIRKFLSDHNYQSHYQRISYVCRHGIEDVEWIDVGSWSEFFYIYPVSRDVVEAHFEKGDI